MNDSASTLVAAVKARLAARAQAPSPAAALVELPHNYIVLPALATPGPCGGLQEAASVLISFQPDTLKPVPNAPADDTSEQLLSLSVPFLDSGTGLWTLHADARIAALRQLRTTDRVNAALNANTRSSDPVQKTLDTYLSGVPKPVEQQSLVDLTALQQIDDWLRQAGFANVPDQSAAQSRADWLNLLQPFEHIAGDFFRGRKSELARLRSYVGILPPGVLESVRRTLANLFITPAPLLIYGPGGVGKSTLVSRFILEHARALEGDRFPFAYLDFDRPEVNGSQPLTLLIEAVRQLGIEYKDSRDRCERIRQNWLQLFRNLAVSSTPTSAAPSLPATALSSAVIEFKSLLDSLGVADRPVVMVLDTFEEVQYKSDEQVSAIWNLLDTLRNSIDRLRVIIVGRATVPTRDIEEVELKEFDTEAALGYLQSRGIGNSVLAAQIVNVVGGSPMNLHLAADIATRENLQTASELAINTREYFFLRLDSAQIQRQLYQRVLEHVHDERVKKLARPGLVLRRITPDLILRVLNEPCRLGLASLSEATELFSELRREVSLVRVEPDGSLVHRPELRRQTLALLRQDEPAKASEIHQAAVNYYQSRPPNPQERAEEIYHRLALGEDQGVVTGRWLSGIEPFLQDAFEEFTGSNRAFLATRLGFEVDEETRKLATLQDWETIAERKASDMLSHGDPVQAVAQLNERADRTPLSRLFALEATALARLRRFVEAFSALDRGITSALQASSGGSQVLTLLLQASDLALTSRNWQSIPWLVPRLQGISQSSLIPEDRVALFARKIALANIDVPLRIDPSVDLEGDLRKAFDELSDSDLTRRPSLAWWAASVFQAEDLPRLQRVIQYASVPRVGVDRELRDLASRITYFDGAVSKELGEVPGLLAKECGIPVFASLTSAWSDFVIAADAARLREVLDRLLSERRSTVPVDVIQAVSNVMRAALGFAFARIPMTPAPPQAKPTATLASSRAQLTDVLVRSFKDADTFNQFLRQRLDWSLDSISAPGPLTSVVFTVVTWAESRGLLLELVDAARQANPQDAELTSLASDLGISALGATQSMVGGASLRSPSWDAARLGLIEAQVCRLEAGSYFATAFLIGPDLVLTCDHALNKVHSGATRASEVRLRFDYRTTADRVLSEGTVFTLDNDWLVAHSSPGDPTNPALSAGLDFALLRVRDSPGSQPIGGPKAESSAALRQWVTIDPPDHVSSGETIVLVQHSQGGPLKIAFGQVSPLFVGKARVAYDVEAWPGSTGGPCFTNDFRLLAFHGGLLAAHDSSPEIRYGTLISAVLQDLNQKGLGHLLGRSVL